MSRLFYEDEFDALQTMIGESGKTVGECAHYLYPDMKPESAYSKLKDQLNPKGSEELKFRQVIALMKFCKQYDPLMYSCDETLHARPDRKSVDDVQVTIIETINSAAAIMTLAMNQLEAIKRSQNQVDSLKRVQKKAA